MRFWEFFGASPEEHYPNRLDAAPAQIPPDRSWLLVLLVVVCLLPRLWSAWHWDILWSDTISYLTHAEALDEGHYDEAFKRIGLNVYPVLLMWLRRTGLDITVTGEWWSVSMATLAVLPLFGWVRRQFDDRVAVVACLLYAFHPKLVIFSPLVIRDSTFWLLFNLSLYLMWRATVENRWWLFATAGVALTLCVHTRIEGWILVVPVMLWPLVRLRGMVASRAHLIGGTLLCLALIPATDMLVNVTWLRDHPQWEIARVHDVQRVWQWVASFGKKRPGADSQGATVAKVDEMVEVDQPTRPTPDADSQTTAVAKVDETVEVAQPTRPTPLHYVEKLLNRLMKIFTYGYGLLALMGIASWRGDYFRRDHQVLFVMGISLMLAVYIRYYFGYIDIRYLLPIVLVSFSWMALGLFYLRDLLVQATARRRAWNERARGVLLLGLLAIVALLGLFDMNATAEPFMRRQVALGRWIAEELGPELGISSNCPDTRLVAYYSRGRLAGRLELAGLSPDVALEKIESSDAAVVLLWPDDARPIDGPALADGLVGRRESEYWRVGADRLPLDAQEVVVLVRIDKAR